MTLDRTVSWAQVRFLSLSWRGVELTTFPVTDITIIKKAEAITLQVVEQRALDAEENRRSQEAFVDMASHELRNRTSPTRGKHVPNLTSIALQLSAASGRMPR